MTQSGHLNGPHLQNIYAIFGVSLVRSIVTGRAADTITRGRSKRPGENQ